MYLHVMKLFIHKYSNTRCFSQLQHAGYYAGQNKIQNQIMENVLKKICSLTFDTFCEHIMQSDTNSRDSQP